MKTAHLFATAAALTQSPTTTKKQKEIKWNVLLERDENNKFVATTWQNTERATRGDWRE